MSKTGLIILAAAILVSCTSVPPKALMTPGVITLKGECSYDSIHLEATLENAENLTAAGFYLWREGEEHIRRESIPSGGKIETVFNGLIPSTSYQYAAFLSNGKQEILSGTQVLVTAKLPMPELVWTKTDTISSDNVTVKAGFTGTEFLDSCSLLLWEMDNDSRKSQWTPDFNGDEAVFLLTGLKPLTSYCYSIVLSNGQGSVDSQVFSFTTQEMPFSVEIETSVTADYFSAVLKAVFKASHPDFSCGFMYGSADAPDSKAIECVASGGVFSYELSGLEPATEYVFRAYFTRDETTITSETHSFSTLRIPVPEITQIDVAAKTYSATLIATITNDSHITESGFILYDSDHEAARVPISPSGGILEFNWDNLTPETEYGFSVFCGNGYESVESAVRTFRTSRQEFEPGLLEYLLSNFDTNSDGAMSQAELQGITEVVLSDIYLESLNGLETLVNLKSLSMGNNWLESIDLSANKKLEFFSGGRDARLKQITLDNPELNYLYLLYADNLQTIDVSLCPKLSNFECYGVKLETMDFSKCGQLRVVFIHESDLKELDLSKNWNLKHLGIHDNPSLSTIWLKEGIIMENIDVDSNVQIFYK